MHYDARGFFLEEAMALKATKAEVWAATIEDRAGGAADKLEALARGGANLEMLLARRTDQPGQGVMFVTPVKGAKAVKIEKPARAPKPAKAPAKPKPAPKKKPVAKKKPAPKKVAAKKKPAKKKKR